MNSRVTIQQHYYYSTSDIRGADLLLVIVNYLIAKREGGCLYVYINDFYQNQTNKVTGLLRMLDQYVDYEVISRTARKRFYLDYVDELVKSGIAIRLRNEVNLKTERDNEFTNNKILVDDWLNGGFVDGTNIGPSIGLVNSHDGNPTITLCNFFDDREFRIGRVLTEIAHGECYSSLFSYIFYFLLDQPPPLIGRIKLNDSIWNFRLSDLLNFEKMPLEKIIVKLINLLTKESFVYWSDIEESFDWRKIRPEFVLPGNRDFLEEEKIAGTTIEERINSVHRNIADPKGTILTRDLLAKLLKITLNPNSINIRDFIKYAEVIFCPDNSNFFIKYKKVPEHYVKDKRFKNLATRIANDIFKWGNYPISVAIELDGLSVEFSMKVGEIKNFITYVVTDGLLESDLSPFCISDLMILINKSNVAGRLNNFMAKILL